MTSTVTRLYDNYESASRAVHELESTGIPHKDISLVASNADGSYRKDGKTVSSPAAEGAATGAGIGAAIGGTAGLLTGLGLLAIPGVGPVVAAGWLVATAVGATAGAVSGGLTGALIGAGTSKEDAHVYAEGVRRGGTLLSVRISDDNRGRVEDILDRFDAVDIRTREKAYRASGWTAFDEKSKPYTSDEITREREMIRRNAA